MLQESDLEQLAGLNAPDAIYNPDYGSIVANSAFAEAFAKALGTDQGIYFELNKVYKLLNQIKGFDPMTEEQKAGLATLSSPVFLRLVERQGNITFKNVEF